MFGWIKDKVTGVANEKSAEALRAEFEALDQVPGAKAGLAERLSRFVLTGEEKGVVAELASMQSPGQFFVMSTHYYSSAVPKRQGLPALAKLLPEDPDLYLRLATVYETASQVGSGGFPSYLGVAIPAFQGSLSWLNTFLNELSDAGKERNPFFPTGLLGNASPQERGRERSR
jgi:hypothetical protein